MTPTEIASLLTQRHKDLTKYQGTLERTTSMIVYGARIQELEELHDLLASHGVADPRPKENW